MKQSLANGAESEVGKRCVNINGQTSVSHTQGFLFLFVVPLSDYKQTSLAKYVRLFDHFLDAMGRSRKGEMLKKSGMFLK